MQYEQKATAIRAVIQSYFEGLYQGDVSRLKTIFSETAHLYGDIKGAEYVKSLAEYLKGVEERKSPQQLGEDFQMNILSIEVMGNIAIAKLHVPMLGFNYYDYLSLCQVNKAWKIVNKIFTHVE